MMAENKTKQIGSVLVNSVKQHRQDCQHMLAPSVHGFCGSDTVLSFWLLRNTQLTKCLSPACFLPLVYVTLLSSIYLVSNRFLNQLLLSFLRHHSFYIPNYYILLENLFCSVFQLFSAAFIWAFQLALLLFKSFKKTLI